VALLLHSDEARVAPAEKPAPVPHSTGSGFFVGPDGQRDLPVYETRSRRPAATTKRIPTYIDSLLEN